MTFEEIKLNLSQKCVGIAGCGGLGSNAAIALARVGIGKLIIADFDIVEKSNLNRQYYFTNQIGQNKVEALAKNIQMVNPAVKTEQHILKLTSQNITPLFRECSVIIEAFDKDEMKEMILETVQSEMPEKPIVSGVGMAGWGGNEIIKTKQFGNLYIVGDGRSEANIMHPPIAPRVGIVSNMMANIVLEILLGKDVLNEIIA